MNTTTIGIPTTTRNRLKTYRDRLAIHSATVPLNYADAIEALITVAETHSPSEAVNALRKHRRDTGRG